MNITLYEPDCENHPIGVAIPFMRVSNFGSFVKLEDYEALEKLYEALLESNKHEDEYYWHDS